MLDVGRGRLAFLQGRVERLRSRAVRARQEHGGRAEARRHEREPLSVGRERGAPVVSAPDGDASRRRGRQAQDADLPRAADRRGVRERAGVAPRRLRLDDVRRAREPANAAAVCVCEPELAGPGECEQGPVRRPDGFAGEWKTCDRSVRRVDDDQAAGARDEEA
jgi:hypothetical protein